METVPTRGVDEIRAELDQAAVTLEGFRRRAAEIDLDLIADGRSEGSDGRRSG
jgi:hypothetical protein